MSCPHELLQARIEERSAEEWIPVLESFDVITAPILDYETAVAQPQVVNNEMIIETTNGRAVGHKHVGVPVKLSATPGAVTRGAPGVGQDTIEVLTELGLNRSEITELEEIGAIAIGDEN